MEVREMRLYEGGLTGDVRTAERVGVGIQLIPAPPLFTVEEQLGNSTKR
jgi:hypothetical protein